MLKTCEIQGAQHKISMKKLRFPPAVVTQEQK